MTESGGGGGGGGGDEDNHARGLFSMLLQATATRQGQLGIANNEKSRWVGDTSRE